MMDNFRFLISGVIFLVFIGLSAKKIFSGFFPALESVRVKRKSYKAESLVLSVLIFLVILGLGLTWWRFVWFEHGVFLVGLIFLYLVTPFVSKVFFVSFSLLSLKWREIKIVLFKKWGKS